ncbi:oxygen-independent coproporphyrinogen-3 oxidase [Novosphingobium kunmingense]|uniref:Coproporphyrinogen-III oxidase n=1 Tax=Novosphingobium kunmingense TaxID=1211806 RepID=A0A2N0I2Z3_9SPHN|nr:radical SAM protein [Novosphingobium kunmingense]PKB25520.1 oxygen-independent coproporphyrinogen-3 oxidase [Novosphingobium kunmingense]
MWPYHPDLLTVPVPRYTSYPTAADFGAIDAALLPSAISGATGDISLYVHIPFCEQICHYCGCNTGAAGRRQRLDSYLAALAREIGTVSALLQPGARVRRVSFGGGSPNALDPIAFIRLFDRLIVAFGLTDPIMSIELDPRSMTADWMKALRTVGVQRASLGVQTFASHCQQAIGRVQDEDTIVRSVDWLREAGVSSLNFDLMYGLPGQSRDDLTDALHRTRVLGADRIALFGYAHVPHVVPRQRAIDATALPDQAERFAMASLGHTYLASHGYVPVGFDHFARAGGDPLARAALEGRVRRNFQGFTDDDAPNLVGLGASAISQFPHLIAQNEKNSGRYRMLAGDGLLTADRGIVRTADDQQRGAAIEALLCQGRARLTDDLMGEIAPRLQPFIDQGLVTSSKGWVVLAPDGLPYARTVAALLDRFRAGSPRQFSAAV